MMHFSKTLKTTALAGLVGLGFVVASTTPALAERSYTRCGGDGCFRVVCDNDGDRCRRINASYYGHRDDNRDYYNNGYYGHDHYRGRGYYNTGYRHWVCDRYGDCRWSYRR